MSENILVPDGITPVVGWRAWGVNANRLHSWNAAKVIWNPGEPLRAECNVKPTRSTTMYQPMAPSAYGMSGAMPTPVSMSEEDFRRAEMEHARLHSGTTVPSWSRKHRSFGILSPLYGEWISVPRMPEVDVRSPAEMCSCGVYAARYLNTAFHYAPNGMYATDRLNLYASPQNMGRLGALGRVALWGKVVIHETGWRGEFAYPQALYVADESLKTALAEYGVPVLSVTDLPMVTKEDAPQPTVPTNGGTSISWRLFNKNPGKS